MDNRLLESKLVPVVVFKSIEEVNPTIDALKEGGIKVVEICFRTACAYDGLVKTIREYPDLLVGAGTVINKDQAIKAIEAGAKFIVSPGLSVEVAKVCKEYDVTYLPGVVTPTEIIAALDLGLTYLKFFPAGVFGGLKALKALHAAFPQVKFMPTGGADNSNLQDFVKEDFIFAVGGSFFTKGDIVSNCKLAVSIVKGENK